MSHHFDHLTDRSALPILADTARACRLRLYVELVDARGPGFLPPARGWRVGYYSGDLTIMLLTGPVTYPDGAWVRLFRETTDGEWRTEVWCGVPSCPGCRHGAEG